MSFPRAPELTRHLFVHGRVQGVGFRYHTRREAQGLGLAGWIRNCACGRRVELLVEGPKEAVDALVAWCAHGPPHARVDQVELLSEPIGDPISDSIGDSILEAAGEGFRILPTR